MPFRAHLNTSKPLERRKRSISFLRLLTIGASRGENCFVGAGLPPFFIRRG